MMDLSELENEVCVVLLRDSEVRVSEFRNIVCKSW